VLDVSYHASGESLDFEHTITRTRVSEPALTLAPDQPMEEAPSSPRQTDSLVFERAGVVVMRAQVLPNEVVLENADNQLRAKRWFRSTPFLAVLGTLTWEARDATWAELSVESCRVSIQSAGRMDEGLERFDSSLKFYEGSANGASAGPPNGIPLSSLKPSFHLNPEGTSATFSPGFLERAAHVLGYDSASVRFDVERVGPQPGQQSLRLSNPRFFFKRSGEEISHDLLSYGQKRLIAFFAHADTSRDVLIADELVNGLHHEWITACLDELGDRQAFLTSQNPLLLDFLRFNSVEEVRRTFILCERTSDESGTQLVWRNPSEDEAESFFLAYQTGIQRVSDILLTKGLW